MEERLALRLNDDQLTEVMRLCQPLALRCRVVSPADCIAPVDLTISSCPPPPPPAPSRIARIERNKAQFAASRIKNELYRN